MSDTCTKRLGMLRKRDDMSHEQFVQHWTTTHAALCKQLPGLRRYSVNLVDRGRFPKFGYDGSSELWFDSEDNLNAAFASAEGRILLADLPNSPRTSIRSSWSRPRCSGRKRNRRCSHH